MFRCIDCGEVFDEPEYKHVCMESYYGVASQFDNYNYASISICPCCGSEDLEESYDDWEYDDE